MKVIDAIVPERADRVPFAIFVVFLIVLAIAGGGSRADILGQAVIRGAAIATLIAIVLIRRPVRVLDYRMVALPLCGMAILIALQLVPLPPAIWTSLPGRDLFATLAPTAGLPQPWRPLNIMPDYGVNALFSLLPPAAMLMVIASLTGRGCDRLQLPVLLWIVASALLALAQAAGMMPDNPLLNSVGDNAGFFANRNHQALFLAIGILLSFFWGFDRGVHWRNRRMWLALAIAMLLFMSILISGSRSGMLLGIFALLIGLPSSQKNALAKGWRKRTVAMTVAALLLIGLSTYLSIYAGRAISVDRATAFSVEGDFRLRALPSVWRLVQTYFPFGAGFGSFDTAFRIAEPFDLLEPTYYNHAHNDLIEMIFEGGLPALLIMVASAIALVIGGLKVFFARTGDRSRLREGRLGFLIIGLVVLASASDYPARTPSIMSILVIAGCWLCRGKSASNPGDASGRGTLPVQSDPL